MYLQNQTILLYQMNLLNQRSLLNLHYLLTLRFLCYQTIQLNQMVLKNH